MNSAERETSIRDLFPLVKRLAGRVHRLVPGSDREDLVGDGCMGAIRAVDNYDAQRGVPLHAYAARVIVGAMLNGIRSMDTVPERVRREIRAADRERYEIALRSGTFPSQTEMEKRRPRLRRAVAMAARYTPLSLDGPLPGNECLGADWTGDPAAIVWENARRAQLGEALRALPPRERRVIALYYFQGASLGQVGRMLSISGQRASQLHLAGMKRLRASINGPH